jgi:hypothetical protein
VTTPRAAARAAKLLVETHDCVDCRALPPRPFDPADVEEDVEYRPKKPLATVSGGPRSRRCHRHTHAAKRSTKVKAAAARSRKRSGVDEATRQAVKALQGDRCPCGARLLPLSGKRLEPDADHDHELAAEHDHPEDVACPECFRGFLCRHCNREVIGFLSHSGTRPTSAVIVALRSLADYLEYPPMRRLLAVRPDLLEESA